MCESPGVTQDGNRGAYESICLIRQPVVLRISVIPYTQFGVFERAVSEAA